MTYCFWFLFLLLHSSQPFVLWRAARQLLLFRRAWYLLKKLTGALMADEWNDVFVTLYPGPSFLQELDVPSQLLRGASYVPRSKKIYLIKKKSLS